MKAMLLEIGLKSDIWYKYVLRVGLMVGSGLGARSGREGKTVRCPHRIGGSKGYHGLVKARWAWRASSNGRQYVGGLVSGLMVGSGLGARSGSCGQDGRCPMLGLTYLMGWIYELDMFVLLWDRRDKSGHMKWEDAMVIVINGRKSGWRIDHVPFGDLFHESRINAFEHS
ncbi:unnamed protein product [Dovyalis caffra]|uniref:Uncharacterized protein n=1 Tax=Dovyalis caffra TaxID=77055 RepID=A0AAV1SIH7_9ROSI|nr:unnamed protein product [Dovyalis caffra]